MHVIEYFGDKVYCPFCGKLAYDRNQDEAVSQTCEHVLLQGCAGGDCFDVLRDDIAGDDGLIREDLLDRSDEEGEEEADLDYSVMGEVERADLPDAVCIAIEPTCICATEGYVAFSDSDYENRTLAKE